MIKYSAPIAKFVWKEREDGEEFIIEYDGIETVTAMVAILGLYFMVSESSKVISELIKFAIKSPEYYDGTYFRNTIIAGIAYELIIFMFGMFLFTKAEEIINFRKKIRREPEINGDESD